ncbi:MAG: hypothetical protein ACK550_15275, partial [Synechococcaceae cyanobacterium]
LHLYPWLFGFLAVVCGLWFVVFDFGLFPPGAVGASPLGLAQAPSGPGWLAYAGCGDLPPV